jgi:hypothetical protein
MLDWILIRVWLDWSGGVEELRVLQVVAGLDPGGHEAGRLAPQHLLPDPLLHGGAEAGDVVLVDEAGVRRHKLAQQLRVPIVRLGAAAGGVPGE